MSVERSGQAIGVETSKGQLATGGARGFDEGRQLFIDGTSRMNREVQVRICEGLGVKSPGPTRHLSVLLHFVPGQDIAPLRPGIVQRAHLGHTAGMRRA
jgi:hypothetical protein